MPAEQYSMRRPVFLMRKRPFARVAVSFASFAIVAGILSLLATDAMGEELNGGRRQLTRAQLQQVLRQAGGEQIATINSPYRATTAMFGRYRLIVQNRRQEGSLQIRVVFTNRSPITEELLTRANAWNRDRRYTELYLDEQGDWVLETDLNLSGGVSQENIVAVIALFLETTRTFDRFLNEI